MTVMTQDEIEALLDGAERLRRNYKFGSARDVVVSNFEPVARTALALHQQLADAQAAQALVVERAAALCASTARAAEDNANISREACASELYDAIRALADPSGVEALAALRALVSSSEAERYRSCGELLARAEKAEAERDALAAKLAAAEARVGADADLILDAYKAVLVLHRILDKIGLAAGVKTSENIADRIVAAHPEMPARTSLRAALTTPAEETKG